MIIFCSELRSNMTDGFIVAVEVGLDLGVGATVKFTEYEPL
jgi:hypothetical protein